MAACYPRSGRPEGDRQTCTLCRPLGVVIGLWRKRSDHRYLAWPARSSPAIRQALTPVRALYRPDVHGFASGNLPRALPRSHAPNLGGNEPEQHLTSIALNSKICSMRDAGAMVRLAVRMGLWGLGGQGGKMGATASSCSLGADTCARLILTLVLSVATAACGGPTRNGGPRPRPISPRSGRSTNCRASPMKRWKVGRVAQRVTVPKKTRVSPMLRNRAWKRPTGAGPSTTVRPSRRDARPTAEE